jgi:hypothetical protein
VSDASIVGAADASPAAGGSIAFARPKSSSFTPERVIMTFPGLRSRCAIPRACAAARPSAICAPIRSTSATGSAPRANRRSSDSPSSSSITK